VFISVPSARLSPAEAVRSYLFNGQLVTVPGGAMAFIAPAECAESEPARAVLDEILAADNPIRSVHFVQVRESMRNGGGPACLRLRVVLTAEELAAAHSPVFLTPVLLQELRGWVCRHYRDRLRPEDLADPALLRESRAALDDLSRLLDLGSIYRFQQC
jgi:succinylarginine dihydrolase